MLSLYIQSSARPTDAHDNTATTQSLYMQYKQTNNERTYGCKIAKMTDGKPCNSLFPYFQLGGHSVGEFVVMCMSSP